MREYVLNQEDAGTRLDAFLAAQDSGLSRARIQSLIKAGHVLLDGRTVKPAEKMRRGQRVTIVEPPDQPVPTEAEDIALDVLFEDSDLIVLNKPAGMVVHPAAGNREHTLVNALLHHCGGLSSIGGEQRPGVVHRLDKETSGCLVVAKNDFTHQSLTRQFAERTVTKLYLALVRGRLRQKQGVIETLIGRHPIHRKKMAVVERGRAAKTAYRVVEEYTGASLVECTLHTGRTHQIRVHLKHLGHPILGDAVYGSREAYPRQMLHAWKLGFAHPRNGKEMAFEAPLPTDFRVAEL